MAVFGSSDESIGVLIKTNADLKGINETNDAVSRMGSKFDSVGAKTVAVGNLIADGLKQAGNAIIGLSKSAIESTASYEQSRLAFDTMLGSAEKAQSLMTEIAAFAKTTPFELPEVVSGTKQLLAFGFAQQDLLPTMRKLGDLASGLGVPIGQLTNVFGQVKVAGRLMGQDLLQFTNAGVPMIEALATTMKKPQGEIKKLVEQGKIGFPEVEKALNSLTGEGSKFGGMMDKQSKSFSGIVSNIKDGFGQILRSAMGMTVAGEIIEGGLFDRMKNGAERVMPIVQRLAENVGPAMGELMTIIGNVSERVFELGKIVYDYLEPKFVALFNTIKDDLLPAMLEFWHNYLEPLMPIIGVALVGAIGLAIDAANMFITAFSSITNWINANEPIFWTLIGLFTVLAAKMAFDTIVNTAILAFNRFTLITLPSLQASLATTNAALTGFTGFAVITAAAVAATIQIVRVFNALEDIKRLNNEISGQMSSHGAGTTAFYESLKRGVAAGKFSQEEANRRMKEYNANFQSFPARAEGGHVQAGKTYQVNEQGLELYTPNRSGRIIPADKTAELIGQGAIGGGQTVQNTRTVNVQNVYLSSADAVREFFDSDDTDTELEAIGFATIRGAY